MRQVLRKDPLIEVVCEFHLDVPDWDWTIPGLVYKRIKDRFPHKVESPHINFHIEQTPQGVQPSAQASIGRMQFWGDEREKLVQIGPEQLSIHQLKPYSGWPNFKALVEQVLSEYENEAPFRAIRRIILRYINRLPLPDTPHKIENMVRVMPQIPDSTNQLWASWFQQVEILQPQNNASLLLRSGHLPKPPPANNNSNSVADTEHIVLDLMFAHADNQPIEREAVSQWLEMAHNEIEALFFKSLQPEYLKTFEPEKDNDEKNKS